jgi:hypothetical protein
MASVGPAHGVVRPSPLVRTGQDKSYRIRTGKNGIGQDLRPCLFKVMCYLNGLFTDLMGARWTKVHSQEGIGARNGLNGL